MKSSAYEGMASSLLNYKEEYKYTPLLRKIEKKFNSLSPEKSLNKNIKDYKGLIPQSEKFYLFILNGNYEESLSNKPDNILVSEYSKLSIKQKEEFSKSYSKYDDSKSDFFSSANTINHDDCLIIRIERNKALKENIAIINIIDSSQPTYFRKCIIVEKNSEISFSEEFINSTNNISFSNTVSEIFLDENSKLNYYSVQNMNKNYHFNSINVLQKSNITSNFHTYSFTGEIIRNNLFNTFANRY